MENTNVTYRNGYLGRLNHKNGYNKVYVRCKDDMNQKSGIYVNGFNRYYVVDEKRDKSESIKKSSEESSEESSNYYRFSDNIAFVNYVWSVDWNKVRPKRGGVILYTIINGNLLFGFGVDSKYADITDFGGTIEYEKDFDAITGCLREFTEESLYCFGSFDKKSVQSQVSVYSETMIILFLHVEMDIVKGTELFYDRVANLKNPEVSDMIWLTREQLMIGILTGWVKRRQIYSKVRKLLHQSGDFYRYL